MPAATQPGHAEPPDTAALVAALRRADRYPHAVDGPVGFLQTHVSLLFFAGAFVYKVKRPVALAFLDFSTRDLRRRFCEEEVRLNRRLAPDVYLGVVPIARDQRGEIRIDGSGETIDHAVKMHRLPAAGMLDSRLASNAIDAGAIRRIADTLASFHARCPTGPGVDEYSTPAALVAQIEDNLEQLTPFAGPRDRVLATTDRVLTPARLAFLRAHLAGFLADHGELLDRRVREGRIREGHGDLHAGNVCLVDDRIVIYDCIEFDPALRCRDVASEIAFLAMDLDARDAGDLARVLVDRYVERSEDAELRALLDPYKIHLAAVRGKVAALRAVDPDTDPEQVRDAHREAMRYFDLAAAVALPSPLILTCGLPASGKSVAARALARPFGATVLRSDVVRKERFGSGRARAEDAELDAGLYAPAVTERTYETLLADAKATLAGGRPVVLDATFPTAALRGRFLDATAALDAEAIVVEMRCDDETTRRRLRRRARDGDDPSDADWTVYRHAKRRFERPDEVPAARRVVFDGDVDEAEITLSVIDALIALRG